jgi:hypothetical protein
VVVGACLRPRRQSDCRAQLKSKSADHRVSFRAMTSAQNRCGNEDWKSVLL